MKRTDVAELYRLLSQENPEPQSELVFASPYELLVSVTLAAQATDKSVNIATEKLYPIANTPEAILALGEEGLTPYVRSIGLYRNKVKHIIAAAKILIEKFDSRVPENFDDLVSLPGVGAKTANVVLNVAFGKPTIPVDTHVFRVSNRTGLASGKTPDEVMEKLLKVTPTDYARNAHHWLLLHGRYCCTARKPHCPACPVAHLCRFKDKTAE